MDNEKGLKRYCPDNPDFDCRGDAVKAQCYLGNDNSWYCCNDNFHMATINDNSIYIAVTDNQHNQIISGETVTADGGLSGYFTDQATIDACIRDGALDNCQYCSATQIQPFFHTEPVIKDNQTLIDAGEATYKPHIDCFRINYDKLLLQNVRQMIIWVLAVEIKALSAEMLCAN